MALLSQGPSSKAIIGGLSLLIFILYALTPSSTDKVSAKLIIPTTSSSDLSWVPSSKHPFEIHTIDTSIPFTSSNTNYTEPISLRKAPTALTILTFLIENYDSLPEISFFHHDSAQTWHSIHPSALALQNIHPSTIMHHGYISPRCLPGCENLILLSSALASPLHELTPSTAREVVISSVLAEFNVFHANDIGREMGRVPKKIAAPCCSTFAVTKERVLRRDREVYEALRTWILETKISGATAGRVLEYTWHLWFGMEDVFCPSEAQCLCDVYNIGVCNREL